MVNSGAEREPPARSGPRWLLAAVWLFYLGEPLQALIRDATGWRRGLGLVALAAFCVLYLYGVSQARRHGRTGGLTPLRQRWAILAGLVLLETAMIPGATYH